MSDAAAILAIANNQTHQDTTQYPAGHASENDPNVLVDDKHRIIGLRNPQPGDLPTTATDEQPRLWPEIQSLIETHIHNQPRSQQVELGPSELGTTCVHCLAAKLAGWPRQNRQAAWLPFIGTSVHAQFEQLFPALNEQGFDDTGKGIRFETEKKVTVGHLSGLYGGYDIGGHIDLYDRWNKATADWKVTGTSTLRSAKANGPSQQYRIQASLYGIGLDNENEPIERCCIYFLPRNGISLNDAVTWESDWDPRPGRWALARAQLLVNFMDVIEQADGPEVRDAWISLLPKATDHCFDCGSWPDDGTLNEFNDSNKAVVPDKWKQLIPLLDPQYSGATA
ncbi:MAG: hypothetical protein SOI13_01060 [Bifidobacterium mongoliense]|jgi:hypothetical protein|uniref:hypothetical protein n=1 Tax=Bifidobacterium mongoliense TaxID=518643 RepID=UPI002F3559C7